MLARCARGCLMYKSAAYQAVAAEHEHKIRSPSVRKRNGGGYTPKNTPPGTIYTPAPPLTLPFPGLASPNDARMFRTGVRLWMQALGLVDCLLQEPEQILRAAGYQAPYHRARPRSPPNNTNHQYSSDHLVSADEVQPHIMPQNLRSTYNDKWDGSGLVSREQWEYDRPHEQRAPGSPPPPPFKPPDAVPSQGPVGQITEFRPSRISRQEGARSPPQAQQHYNGAVHSGTVSPGGMVASTGSRSSPAVGAVLTVPSGHQFAQPESTQKYAGQSFQQSPERSNRSTGIG